jgi:hypothetical protein
MPFIERLSLGDPRLDHRRNIERHCLRASDDA